MKKIIAMLLAALMALGMVACGAAEEATTTAPATTEAAITVGSAVEVLENVWALYNEETEKFFAMGGDFDAPVDNAPGAATNAEWLEFSLLIPNAELANVTEAASLMHGMNANTFTAGCYKVADVDAFAATMQNAIQNNQWMCGFPENLYIANVGGYCVVAFGLNDTMNVFKTHMAEAYPSAIELVNEAIG